MTKPANVKTLSCSDVSFVIHFTLANKEWNSTTFQKKVPVEGGAKVALELANQTFYALMDGVVRVGNEQ